MTVDAAFFLAAFRGASRPAAGSGRRLLSCFRCAARQHPRRKSFNSAFDLLRDCRRRSLAVGWLISPWAASSRPHRIRWFST